MSRLRLISIVLSAFALVVAVGACGGGGSDSNSDTAAATSSPSGESGSSGESGPSKESVAFGVKWIGGKEEEADSSLPPVEIGFVNQEGAVPSYAEQRKALEPAVDFVNERLGGIEGHPIKIDYCVVQGEADGQKCAAQFLNEGLQVIQYGLMAEGDTAFFKTIAGKVPVMIDVATGTANLTAENGYTYTAGGAAVVGGMTYSVAKHGYKSVALVSSSNPIGKVSVEEYAVPPMEEDGATVKATFISDAASQPEFTSAAQAAGASSADVVMQFPPGGTQCTYLLQGLQQLGLEKPVINTYSCYAPEVLEAFGGNGPEGVEMWGFTENPYVKSEQSTVYANVMEAYGQAGATYQGAASMSFSDLLSLAKFGNEIGFKNLNAKSWAAAIGGFEGEAFLVPGKMDCGNNETFTTVCGTSSVASEFKDGEWQKVAEFDTTTGKGS